MIYIFYEMTLIVLSAWPARPVNGEDALKKV